MSTIFTVKAANCGAHRYFSVEHNTFRSTPCLLTGVCSLLAIPDEGVGSPACPVSPPRCSFVVIVPSLCNTVWETSLDFIWALVGSLTLEVTTLSRLILLDQFFPLFRQLKLFLAHFVGLALHDEWKFVKKSVHAIFSSLVPEIKCSIQQVLNCKIWELIQGQIKYLLLR